MRQGKVSAAELYEEACKRYNLFHISLTHGTRTYVDSAWSQLFGKNHKVVKDHTEIPDLIAELVVSTLASKETPVKASKTKTKKESVEETAEETDTAPVML